MTKYWQDLFTKYEADAEYLNKRAHKAKKIKVILNDFKTSGKLLDIGCSIGAITDFLSKDFQCTGIDIDKKAIDYAKKTFPNSEFHVTNEGNLDFDDESFDVVVCNGVYEHVQDPKALMKNIYRVLKPDGVCYFSAMNKLAIIEPHYELPFLSWMPKRLANIYLGEPYMENSMPLWKLKKLVSDFELVDYTVKIIKDPDKYYMKIPKIFQIMARYSYFLIPTYIWILRKTK